MSTHNIRTIDLDGEKIFMKKSSMGWRVVYPIYDPKTNDFSLFNALIGGWENFLITLFIVLLTLSFFYIYWHDTREMQKVVSDPCSYCPTDSMQLILSGRLQDRAAVNAEANDLDFQTINVKAGENEA